jgi:hypothetical protein
MTVVAWDGRTLAADRMANCNGHPRSVTKVFRLDPFRLVAVTGISHKAHEILEWLRDPNREQDKFPRGDDAHVYVVYRDGTAECYEGGPIPVPIVERQFAAGAGRDYALAALYLGYDARRAVEVACALDIYCGNGIDTLSFEDD